MSASDLADQKHVATELTNPNDSDNPSDAAIEQLCDEVAGIKKVLEHLKPKQRNLREN